MHLANWASTPKRLLAAAIFVGATGLGMAAVPHAKHLCEGFLPANTMKIPVGANSKNSGWFAARMFRPGAPAGGLTEAQFNEVMERIERLYTPVVAQAGAKLIVNRLWHDETVNASAEQDGTDWAINMYGGLARHPQTTIEGMALVACHEIGHHIGGAPKVAGWFGEDWATNEGGSDYFATLKCLRNYFAEDDNKTILAAKSIEPYIKTTCAAQFPQENDRLICERISLAGASVAYLFMDLGQETKKPEWNTPDKRVVTQMYDDHPQTQCRMDTYLAGQLCQVDKSTAVSNTDYKEGSCVQGVAEIGYRPRCWFYSAP